MPSQTIYFPTGVLEEVNELVDQNEYDNVSEAVATLTSERLSEKYDR